MWRAAADHEGAARSLRDPGHEPHPRARLGGCGKAKPFVGNLHDDGVTVGFDGHRDLTGAMPHGIVEQHVEGLPERLRRECHVGVLVFTAKHHGSDVGVPASRRFCCYSVSIAAARPGDGSQGEQIGNGGLEMVDSFKGSGHIRICTVEMEQDAETLAECDRLALARFQMLDAMEAEDEKNAAR